MHKKISTVLALALLPLSTQLFAANPNHTEITYNTRNATAAPIVLTQPSPAQRDSGLALSTFTIPPQNTLDTYATYNLGFLSMSRSKPSVVTETFTYASGTKACTFSTTISVKKTWGVFSPSYEATRTASAVSTGTQLATCQARVSAQMGSLPFNYTVNLTIK
ncbi:MULTISPECIES: hypothetical protein [unclassified Pseudomonas]|uniref:hypothetical protein n=1 Tax=unclassified Pseudomonas TaxID=196821 RepID=UPI002AC915B5|nr:MULTISPECIES: hypothetical protein [unclassified Pseudomonas]MEB0045857.1 hypothetical protein [Pseudomonas sp. Dout3]MEB0096655.1 hypothetical protein [Pseudomonas sp. DC1.2]WPX60224.1 hypothetical protein RHM68_06185 [Pseudomonas sp. DC1.2]